MPKPKLPDFFEACSKGDVETLRGLLKSDPSLAQGTNPVAPHAGWTGLHSAARGGHAEAVRLLLKHGADPNAREAGDNTFPLHWAVAGGQHVEAARALLDAGGDVHGFGDVHEMDVIGWATLYDEPGREPKPEMEALLVEHGARHHIFSAIAVGDPELIREVVEHDPDALGRRMSRFEQGQTPLHFAINRKRYDILELLIELGADLEATDQNGHTAFATAMMRGDMEAIRRLHAAGAKGNQGWAVEARAPKQGGAASAGLAELAGATKKIVPMITVPDVGKTLEWYTSIGFREIGRWEQDGVAQWGMLSFGKGELMLRAGGKQGEHDVGLWFYTSEIERLYQLFKDRQIDAARAALAGESAGPGGGEFVEDIYNPPYGAREFGIRDLNGYNLYFLQE